MFKHIEATANKLGHPNIGANGVKNYAARLDNAATLKAEVGDDWPLSVAERMACLNPRGRRKRYSERTRQRYDEILLAAGHLELDGRRDCFWHRKPLLQVVPDADKPDIFVGSKKQNFRTKPPVRGVLPGAPLNLTYKSDGCAVSLGCAEQCSQTKKTKTFGGPGGAASRHSERDRLGRFATIASTGSPTPPAPEALGPTERADASLSRNCLTPVPTKLTRPLSPPKVKPSYALKSNEPVKAIREDVVMSSFAVPAEIAAAIRDPETAAIVARAQAASLKAAAERAAAGIPDPEPWTASPKPAAAPRLAPNGLVREASTRTPRSVRLPDDGTPTDFTWLQLSLGGIASLRGVNWQWAAKQDYSRGQWRAAVGALVARAPGRVDDPVKFVIGVLKQLKAGDATDCRSAPGYFPLATWGGVALKFANVIESPLQS